MKDIEALKGLIASPKKIVITTHINPDADALGSSLGLYHFLGARGHDVHVITPTDYPEFLTWMKGNDEVLIYNKVRNARIKSLVGQADLIFCLDFSGLKRIQDLGELVRASPARKVLIDHHLDPEHFADFELWDNKAAATAELIYDFISIMNGQDEITPDLAECLYAGIMTDTGSFRHPSTSAKIHRIVANLIDAGADVNKVSRCIYDTNTLSRLRFLGYALMEKLVVMPEHKVAYFVITAEEHERFHLRSGDTEGLVNYALSIKDIVIAAIIIEKENEVKMSFRSVGDYAVNTFATKYFNGGGHKNAAGGVSNDSLEETIEKLRNYLTTFETVKA